MRVEPDRTLTVPDYVGNFAFNTLGNIEKDGRCGLLFIDFDSGDVVQLTGSASIDWGAPEVNSAGGVQRLLRVWPMEIKLLPQSFPFVATLIDYSPNLEGIDSI